jgi:PadR family transcriptional regulator, regulatory protein AphA
MLKYALLGFLNYQPLTGYELEAHMRSSTQHFWHARLSQIYMTLKELEADEWVRSTVEPQEKRPDRRVYAITPAGQTAFMQWLRDPLRERTQAKDPLLLKLFFSAAAGKDALRQQIEFQITLHQAQLAEYEGDLPEIAQQLLHDHPERTADAVLWQAVREFGIRYETLYLTWLEATLQKIESDFPATE